MKVADALAQARDAVTVGRVFGEAYEKDGVTIIPAAWVVGGGGAGTEIDRGDGGGFGMMAFPVGAYVIKDGEATWRPAINADLLILASLLTLRTIIKVRARRRR